MIIASLCREANPLAAQASSGFPWRDYQPVTPSPLDAALADRVKTATKLLENAWHNNTTQCKLESTTYGNDDIMSLSWHYDIFKARDSDPSQTTLDPAPSIVSYCEEQFVERANTFASNDVGPPAICDVFRHDSTLDSIDSRVGNSSYILLRFVRCLRSLEEAERRSSASATAGLGIDDNAAGNVRKAMMRAARRFQSRIHDHLSLAEITDSRFDPAELAFCVEGLLHLKPEQVDNLLFDRIVSVLAKAQEQNAYWRSETPILVRRMGHVLFPIGVEAARSILNSVALFIASTSAQGRRREIQPQYIALLKRYWTWLKSRQTVIKRGNDLLYGWHSEHINDPNLIDTWETSQILEFLLGFRTILSADVAHQLLNLSRLAVRYPGQFAEWSSIAGSNEPCKRPPYDVYTMIGRDFVEGRLTNSVASAKNWSMLLYGPPGTGKTTIANHLGDCLQSPVITVTVSDFLGEGESRMESRVKNIFTVIERQRGAIVLFDEMDQFLLDRNSKLFREQDSVFQFLTPGMLTKLANLRKSESVIFIIATNYEERIDPAIKRTGRIDRCYLVLPPDKDRRLAMICDNSSFKQLNDNDDSNKIDRLIEASCLLTFSDIQQIIARRIGDIDSLTDALANATRSIQFSTLSSRYSQEHDSKGIEEETIGLIHLIHEAQRKPMNMSGGNWSGSDEFMKFMKTLPSESPIIKVRETLDAEKVEGKVALRQPARTESSAAS
jgi:Cdc6-like AAA superfamily ATPase